MARILITEFMDETAVDTLRATHEVAYDQTLVERQGEIANSGPADALIVRNRTQVTAEMLDALPGLKCVGRLGVGLDNIDVAACEARNIAVLPATGANALAVAEYVITTAMMLLRGAYDARAGMVAGQWPRQGLVGREISGKTLGLVGFGGIAREVLRLSKPFAMPVIAHDPHLPADHPAWGEAEAASLPDLLSRADVVSLHLPLTPETKGLIGAEAVAGMKPDAVLINTARGGVLDKNAVAEALRTGKLGGAALDVFESEPLNAEAGAAFADTPNLILTPHIGGVTQESNVRVSALIAERVLDCLQTT